MASKFVQDDGEDLGIFNDEWATSAKMDLKRVNQLELEFLTAIVRESRLLFTHFSYVSEC